MSSESTAGGRSQAAPLRRRKRRTSRFWVNIHLVCSELLLYPASPTSFHLLRKHLSVQCKMHFTVIYSFTRYNQSLIRQIDYLVNLGPGPRLRGWYRRWCNRTNFSITDILLPTVTKGPVVVFIALVVQRDHLPCGPTRSEERRVGKECWSWCRSRWSPYH